MPKTDLILKILKNYAGFNATTRKVKYVTAANGSCLATLKIEPEHANNVGGLHGGFSTTLVDVVSSIALFTHKIGDRPSVSVNMHMTYVKDARVGDEIVINARTSKVGKKMAFLDVEIRKKDTNVLLVRGEHTMYFLEASI